MLHVLGDRCTLSTEDTHLYHVSNALARITLTLSHTHYHSCSLSLTHTHSTHVIQGTGAFTLPYAHRVYYRRLKSAAVRCYYSTHFTPSQYTLSHTLCLALAYPGICPTHLLLLPLILLLAVSVSVRPHYNDVFLNGTHTSHTQ